MGQKAKRERKRGDELAIACLVAAIDAAVSMGLDRDAFSARMQVEIDAMTDTKAKKRKR